MAQRRMGPSLPSLNPMAPESMQTDRSRIWLKASLASLQDGLRGGSGFSFLCVAFKIMEVSGWVHGLVTVSIPP